MQQSQLDQSTTSSYLPSHSRSSGSSSGSGSGVSAPRPTLADIDLPPRRRLRDGTRSTATASTSGSASASSSRASSVSSTHSRGRNSRGSTGGRGRGRSVSSFSTVSSNGIPSSSVAMPVQSRTTSGRSRETGTGNGSRVRRSPRTRQTSIPDPDSTLGEGESITAINPNEGGGRRHRISTSPPTIEPALEAEHPSTLIELLDAIDQNRNRDSHERINNDADEVGDNDNDNAPSTSSSSTSTPRHHHNETQVERDRRFTAAEKGKGRAIAPGTIPRTGAEGETITISEDEEEDDVIQVTGIKRKIHTLDDDEEGEQRGLIDGQLGDTGGVVEVVPVDQGLEVKDGLKEFTCPVCFCEPTQAVITVCGHTLCAECLHSSLLAAIARNPNPYPHNHPPRQRPKPKKRGVNKKSKEPQPTEWTVETLTETWTQAREREYEKIARASGMDEASLEAGRNDTPVEVVHVLKGLWKVEGSYWVIEGECPVCRKGLPGGYGPFGKGIGGVLPARARVGSGWGMNRT